MCYKDWLYYDFYSIIVKKEINKILNLRHYRQMYLWYLGINWGWYCQGPSLSSFLNWVGARVVHLCYNNYDQNLYSIANLAYTDRPTHLIILRWPLNFSKWCFHRAISFQSLSCTLERWEISARLFALGSINACSC